MVVKDFLPDHDNEPYSTNCMDIAAISLSSFRVHIDARIVLPCFDRGDKSHAGYAYVEGQCYKTEKHDLDEFPARHKTVGCD